jgi:lysyl-tRNA synthetase class 2
MSLGLTRKIPYLKDRARMLAQARSFFASRNVLEIDCGALLRHPPNDSNIDIIQTDQDNFFLHSSPEYCLKKLLSAGLEDCYYLGHVYRKSEVGRIHNPEFTMAEWYRIGFSLSDMIQETADFLFLFFEKRPIRTLSFRQAFAQYAGINYTSASLEELQNLCQNSWPKEICLHYILSHFIEPHLGQNELTVLNDYPPHEAALAKLVEKNGETVAERFEIYVDGVELANGYHELSDAEELKRRFEEKNIARIEEGKSPYKIDENLIRSTAQLPDCCGVALGFDRAMMLRHQLHSISQVIPFSWDEL